MLILVTLVQIITLKDECQGLKKIFLFTFQIYMLFQLTHQIYFYRRSLNLLHGLINSRFFQNDAMSQPLEQISVHRLHMEAEVFPLPPNQNHSQFDRSLTQDDSRNPQISTQEEQLQLNSLLTLNHQIVAGTPGISNHTNSVIPNITDTRSNESNSTIHPPLYYTEGRGIDQNNTRPHWFFVTCQDVSKALQTTVWIMGLLTLLGNDCENGSALAYWTTVAIFIYMMIIIMSPFLLFIFLVLCVPCMAICMPSAIPVLTNLISAYNDSTEHLVTSNNNAAPEEVIKMLPVVVYERSSGETLSEKIIEDEDALCAICIEDYVPKVLLKILPCGHHYHADCVDKWLRIHDSCPLCVKPIVQVV